MYQNNNRCILSIHAEPESDEEERVALTQRLHQELFQLGEVITIESAPAHPPLRSKAPGIDWQTLVVTLAASGGVLTTLIGTIQAWLARQGKASVVLEVNGEKLEITGASSESQRVLVEEWVRRHSAQVGLSGKQTPRPGT